MTPEQIKLKLQKFRQKEQALLLKEQAIAEFRPLFIQMKANIRQETVNNNILIVKELFSTFQEGMKSEDIIKSIEGLSKKIDNVEMAKATENMVRGLARLEKKNYFDTDEFKSIFLEGLDKVINTLVDPNEVPDLTTYVRNNAGKIKVVTEDYQGFTLKHSWSYDSDGNLKSVRTVRNESQ